MVAKNLISTINLNNNSAVAEAVIAARYSFWNGSYTEGYGNAITGGVHVYLSPVDAMLQTEQLVQLLC